MKWKGVFYSFFLSLVSYLFIHSFHFTIEEYETWHIGSASIPCRTKESTMIITKWENGKLKKKKKEKGEKKREKGKEMRENKIWEEENSPFPSLFTISTFWTSFRQFTQESTKNNLESNWKNVKDSTDQRLFKFPQYKEKNKTKKPAESGVGSFYFIPIFKLKFCVCARSEHWSQIFKIMSPD